MLGPGTRAAATLGRVPPHAPVLLTHPAPLPAPPHSHISACLQGKADTLIRVVAGGMEERRQPFPHCCTVPCLIRYNPVCDAACRFQAIAGLDYGCAPRATQSPSPTRVPSPSRSSTKAPLVRAQGVSSPVTGTSTGNNADINGGKAPSAAAPKPANNTAQTLLVAGSAGAAVVGVLVAIAAGTLCVLFHSSLVIVRCRRQAARPVHVCTKRRRKVHEHVHPWMALTCASPLHHCPAPCPLSAGVHYRRRSATKQAAAVAKAQAAYQCRVPVTLPRHPQDVEDGRVDDAIVSVLVVNGEGEGECEVLIACSQASAHHHRLLFPHLRLFLSRQCGLCLLMLVPLAIAKPPFSFVLWFVSMWLMSSLFAVHR